MSAALSRVDHSSTFAAGLHERSNNPAAMTMAVGRRCTWLA